MMKTMTILLGVTALLVATLIVRPAFTEEKPKELSPQEIQAWYMKMAEVGENHEWMSFMVGKWTAAGKMTMGPEVTPFEGRQETEWALGKHFMRSNYAGTFMGMPYEGEGTLGYDNATKTYKSIWLESMSTMVSMQEGTREGDVVTVKGDVPTPWGMSVGRATFEKKSADEYVYTYYSTKPGQPEAKDLVIVYTRAK